MFVPFCNYLLIGCFFLFFNVMDIYIQYYFSEVNFSTVENKHGQLVFPLLPWLSTTIINTSMQAFCSSHVVAQLCDLVYMKNCRSKVCFLWGKVTTSRFD